MAIKFRFYAFHHTNKTAMLQIKCFSVFVLALKLAFLSGLRQFQVGDVLETAIRNNRSKFGPFELLWTVK